MEENPLPQDSPVTPSKSIQRFQYSLRTLMELTLGVAVIMAVSTWKFDPSNHIAECFGLLLAVLCCYAILKKRWMLIFFRSTRSHSVSLHNTINNAISYF